MTLIRAFTRVAKDGKVALPSNVSREVGLKPGQLVEMKVLGKKAVAIYVRDNAK